MAKQAGSMAWRGLRGRLLIIVLFSVIPLMGLLFTYAGFQNRAAEENVLAEAEARLNADAQSIQDLTSQAEATLVTYGITYAIQAQRWDLVQGNSSRLVQEQPDYAVIAVTDASGRVRASSTPMTTTVDLSSEPLFRDAVETKRVAVSGYAVDRLTGSPALQVSYPVYDPEDQLIAVAYIGYDLALLQERLRAGKQEHAVEFVCDEAGIVLARAPDPTGFVGEDFSELPIVQKVVTGATGRVETTSLDGVKRTHVYRPVFTDDRGELYLTVGFDTRGFFAPIRRALQLTLLGFLAVGALALTIAWLFGTYAVYRPALKLRDATSRLAAGDLSARADMPNTADEFAELGRQFNDMAEAIEVQVEQIDRAQKDLQRLNAELETRVQRRTAELEASNKELESFSYSVSHDLRSPLRAIDGFSQALLEDYSDKLDDEGRSYLTRVREAANRMGDLIDALLKLSRMSRQEMTVSEVDLSKLAAETIVSLQLQEPERSVNVRIAEGVTAYGDRALLSVVLDNLLSNAWKFTAKKAGAQIEFGTVTTDAGEAYFVRDNGAGFDMAYAGKLFGAFQRLHGQNEFPGIGIGLATTSRVVHRHGGSIWAEGEPGGGATFYFTLPGTGR